MAEIATVEMKQIRKEFPATLANDNVDFTAYKGEIHALLGENGAGKSTLMNILTGVLRPDGGEILINGARVSMKSPGDALALGIGMIYQHFKLVKPFTVAENIVLGMEQVKILKTQALEQQVRALSEEYKIDINPASAIWQLSIGEQQRVEILKVLYRKAQYPDSGRAHGGSDPGRGEGAVRHPAQYGRHGLHHHFHHTQDERGDGVRGPDHGAAGRPPGEGPEKGGDHGAGAGPADGGPGDLHGTPEHGKYHQKRGDPAG